MLTGERLDPKSYDRVVDRVEAAADALSRTGVSIMVTGSLARGGVRPDSDVDLLVTACPRHLKYAIEGLVEDHLRGLPFDVVHLDEIPPRKIRSFMEGARDASDLR